MSPSSEQLYIEAFIGVDMSVHAQRMNATNHSSVISYTDRPRTTLIPVRYPTHAHISLISVVYSAVLSSTISRVQPPSPAPDFPIYDRKILTVKTILRISHVRCACTQSCRRSDGTVGLVIKGVHSLCSGSVLTSIGLYAQFRKQILLLYFSGD